MVLLGSASAALGPALLGSPSSSVPTSLDIACVTRTKMHIFDIPSKIRLKIYLELLVLSEPIVFIADYGLCPPLLFRSQREGLCPALLRINKMIYHEANTLLYSNNRFQLPEICTSTFSVTFSAHIAPCLH